MRSPAPVAADHDLARLAAREHVLRLLALAASDPASARFERAFDPQLQELACAAASHLAADPSSQPGELAAGEVSPEQLDLSPLTAALHGPRERLVEDHTRVFGLVASKQCPPYEVEYCPQTFTVYRSQRMADIGGFYRAFGVAPGRDAPERVDHLACELEFLAWLVAKELHARRQQGAAWEQRATVCRDAQRKFLAEHVAWWVPAFARALAERTHSLDPAPELQAALAGALPALVPVERASLGIAPPRELAWAGADQQDTGGACPCAT